MDTEVAIHFACWHCQDAITAKLKCSGAGVQCGSHTVAAVKVGCPTCDCRNQICFDLSGLVLQVTPDASTPLLEPSLN